MADDSYNADEFAISMDAPTHRGGDGSFVPSPESPLFPKSDGLPPDIQGTDPKDTPEFQRSSDATEFAGPRGGLQGLDANGETTDQPYYTEQALEGQWVKQDEADNPQSNVIQPFVAEYERGLATGNTITARGKEGAEGPADADGRGEARSIESVEQVDADRVVEARNDVVEKLKDEQTEDGKDALDQMAKAKADEREASKEANAEALDTLKEKQEDAKKADSEAHPDEIGTVAEQHGTVAPPAAEQGNKNDKQGGKGKK